MRRMYICLLSALSLLAIVSASWASLDSLEGEWTCSTSTTSRLQFYGNQIGCRVTDGVDRYFQYISVGTNSLSLYLGDEEEESVTYEQIGNSLTVTDTHQVDTRYTITTQYTNLCRKALFQLVGAQGICKQDDPDAFMIPMQYMRPYLQTMPACPEGGTYLLQPGQDPACSLVRCNP